MSDSFPYRAPAFPSLPDEGFAWLWRRRLTWVRIDQKRVKVDAPDVVIAMGLILVAVHGAFIAAVLSPTALALCAFTLLLAIATARVQLRVRLSSALLVRTLFGVPWWIARRDERYAAGGNVWLRDTWEGDELVLPARADGRVPSAVIIELGLAGATPELGWVLDREIRRVLLGEPWLMFTAARQARELVALPSDDGVSSGGRREASGGRTRTTRARRRRRSPASSSGQ